MIKRVLLGLAAFVAAALAGLSAYAYAELNGFFVEKKAVAELEDILDDHLIVETPAGDGPFPAVMFFHGCAGLYRDGKPMVVVPDYARIAVEEGYAAVIVDSLTPRDLEFWTAIPTVCRGWQLRGGERAGDVLAALEAVKQHPRLRADGFVLAGWSHGAWAIMDALTFDYRNSFPHNLKGGDPALLESIHSIYTTYPFCSFPARTAAYGWAFKIPVTFVFAEKDQFVSVDDCLAAINRLRADGVPVKLPPPIKDAPHAFDERDNIGDSEQTGYHPEATREAHKRFRAYLRAAK